MFPGQNRVIVSTWTAGTGYDLENFSLEARSKTDGIFSLLCEKGKTLLLKSLFLPVQRICHDWIFTS